MEIQKLDTIIITRGNSVRIELPVTDSNVALDAYDNIKAVIRYGPNDTAPAIFTGQIDDGITIDTVNEKIIITVSHTVTATCKPGPYFGELQTIYDGAPWAEAEFLFIVRQNLN